MVPPAAPPGAGPVPDPGVGTALAVSRKIKLSSVVDVTAEADIVPLPPDSVAEAFRRYRDTRGEYPHPDHEPTSRNSSAVVTDDEQALDSEWPTFSTSTKPDKNAIKEALKAGRQITGALLLTRRSWRIH